MQKSRPLIWWPFLFRKSQSSFELFEISKFSSSCLSDVGAFTWMKLIFTLFKVRWFGLVYITIAQTMTQKITPRLTIFYVCSANLSCNEWSECLTTVIDSEVWTSWRNEFYRRQIVRKCSNFSVIPDQFMVKVGLPETILFNLKNIVCGE